MTPARHADLTMLINRHDDLEALERFRRVVGHELTPDLLVLMAKRVQELKESKRATIGRKP